MLGGTRVRIVSRLDRARTPKSQFDAPPMSAHVRTYKIGTLDLLGLLAPAGQRHPCA
jgi:hypothetical protein